MAYSAVALLAFFAAFHNADGVLGGDSMATAERTLVDEPMMMAPEPEFDLATSRSRVNQDPATLTRPELRYGNYLPLLGRGRRLLDSEEAAAAPAPAEDEEGTLELATERGRLGGRTGMNFGTGTLYTQNRFDNRRHLLEAHDDHDDHDDHDHDHDHEAEAEPAAAVVDDEMASMMMMMAPEPEFDLATSRSRVNQDPATLSRPELRNGNYLPLLGRGRRLLDSEEAAAAPAPAEDEEGTLELATERGRLGGRTGMNFGTGTLYTQNRFDNRRHLLEAHDDHDDHDDHDHDHDHEAEAEPAAAVVDDEMASMMMMMAPEPEFDLATSRSRVNQDPATLSRPELRNGNYLPLLGRGRKLLEEAAAPAPEAGELDLATERGRLGGRTGFNFGSGTLYTQNRFDN
ncbi:hypothetical protein RI054_12g61120 [Pseudoscourfieldia marina]